MVIDLVFTGTKSPNIILGTRMKALLDTPSNERQYDKFKALYEDGRLET